MPDISEHIDIDRPAAEVFAYLDDLTHTVDWQESVLDVTVDGGSPTRVGTRITERRRVPGGDQTVTYAVTEHDPGAAIALAGVAGPVRISARILVAARGVTSSTVRTEFSFAADGMARFVLPVLRREVAGQVPTDLHRLKAVLEAA